MTILFFIGVFQSIFHKFLSDNKIDKKSIIIKNEDMHNNLPLIQKKLCRFLKIKFYPSLLRSTFLNKKWFGESSYLQSNQEKDLTTSPKKKFL